MISFVAVILIKILKIIKNSPTISRDLVRNWVKIENKKKSPSEIEESAEKWWGNYRNMQKIPKDRQICRKWFGKIFELSENSPILETVKILWQDKAVNKKEFSEECAREREIMGQECIKWIEEVWWK